MAKTESYDQLIQQQLEQLEFLIKQLRQNIRSGSSTDIWRENAEAIAATGESIAHSVKAHTGG